MIELNVEASLQRAAVDVVAIACCCGIGKGLWVGVAYGLTCCGQYMYVGGGALKSIGGSWSGKIIDDGLSRKHMLVN